MNGNYKYSLQPNCCDCDEFGFGYLIIGDDHRLSSELWYGLALLLLNDI